MTDNKKQSTTVKGQQLEEKWFLYVKRCQASRISTLNRFCFFSTHRQNQLLSIPPFSLSLLMSMWPRAIVCTCGEHGMPLSLLPRENGTWPPAISWPCPLSTIFLPFYKQLKKRQPGQYLQSSIKPNSALKWEFAISLYCRFPRLAFTSGFLLNASAYIFALKQFHVNTCIQV